MSDILKQYLQTSLESIDQEAREPSIEEMLDLSLESYRLSSEAIDNAISLVGSLESLVDEFDVQPEHDIVSLEQFSDRVGLVLKTAGIKLPVEAMIPSLEEANAPTKAGAGRAAKVKETIQKIWKWIREQFAKLIAKARSSGVWIKAQAEKSRQAASSIKARARAARGKLKFKGRTPKTKASIQEFVKLLKECEKAQADFHTVKTEYVSGGKEPDDAFFKAVDAVDEGIKKVNAIASIDVSEGVDAESLQFIEDAAETLAASINEMESIGLNSSSKMSDFQKKLEQMMAKELKEAEAAGEDLSGFDEAMKEVRHRLKIAQQLETRGMTTLGDGFKMARHGLKLCNEVISAAK